jgi:hypothetical protein
LKRWSDCTVEIFGPDGALEWREGDCDVRLGERDIVISYFDEEGPLVFIGPNDGSGRFELHCRSRVRRAVVQLEADESRLEGSWSESGERGTWRILLRDRGAPR